MADYQKQRAYDWERDNIPSDARTPLSLEGCRELIRHVCLEYRTFMPRLIDGHADNGSWSHPTKGIKLAYHGQNVVIALHEVAHWILQAKGECDGHGPKWVRLYIDLLVRYDQWTEGDLIVSATLAGLDLNRRGTGPQPILAKVFAPANKTSVSKRELAMRMLRECEAEDAWTADFTERTDTYQRKAASE
jgi:hypothetical protein